MDLLTVNTFDSFRKLNKELWKYSWKFWYHKEYIHQGVKEYLRKEMSCINEEKKEIQILDMGCGSAWCAKYFHDLYSKYVGIDFNEELIEQLSHDFADVPMCQFYLCDIESDDVFSFPDKKFNLLLANFILLELSDMELFFQKAASLQEKGDYLIIIGLDPVNEILRISDSTVELEENLNIYRHTKFPLVLTKEMSFDDKASNFKYLRVLYSIKDILSKAFVHSYELVDLDDKYNQHANSSKSPLYYTLKLRRK